jgi:hypothetical protein
MHKIGVFTTLLQSLYHILFKPASLALSICNDRGNIVTDTMLTNLLTNTS